MANLAGLRNLDEVGAPASPQKSDNVDQSSASQQPPIEKPDLEVLEHKFAQKSSVGYIVGKVRNNTPRKYSYVQIEINLMDKEKAVVGSALANVNNLEPGEVWKFEAVALQSDFESYEIKDVTGF